MRKHKVGEEEEEEKEERKNRVRKKLQKIRHEERYNKPLKDLKIYYNKNIW